MTALMLALALSAAAPEKTKEKPPVTEVKFGEGSAIKGERQAPDVLDIDTYRQAKFSNLIKIRENFDDKIVKSVDQM